MFPHILEREGGAHQLCHARRQRPDLCVDIGEVRQRHPSPNPHDRAVRRAAEFQRHGPAGLEAVRGDAVDGVASQEESVTDGAPPYRNPNVPVRDVRGMSRGMYDRVQIGSRRLLVEVGNTACEGGHWADGTPKCVVMDHRPFGAVLGVRNADGGAVCRQKSRPRC